MRVGAYDYLKKGFSIDEIEVTVQRYFKYQKLVHENEMLKSELGIRYGIDNIIGNSPKMNKVFEVVEMVAPTKTTILIQGPSGTGKELIARAIHLCSPRRDKPFIKTNCAAIPDGLMESELFGHEKGAFTGAIRRTKGRFELADGGTLFLDEISEIKQNLQAKLLRVLQEKEFEKVGNPEPVQVDVRIIVTTNRDLLEEVRKGNFREDLFYRLNVVPINLPPLKERKEDIPLLVDYFVAKYCIENDRTIKNIDEEALKLLMQYDWPGNVRELENTIERAVVISKEQTIHTKHLYFGDYKGGENTSTQYCSLPSGVTLKEFERMLILQTLREQGGNRTWAAEKLGISVRTLRNKLREYRNAGLITNGE
jgi:DNA-binding NtrC family response regulator